MTIGMTSLTSGASAVDATSQATASITPTANRLIVATITSSIAAGTPNVPTATGNGLTYVAITNQLQNQRRITTFRAMGASPSAGAITFDFAGQTQDTFNWSVVEFDTIDTSGTNGSGAIVQSATNSTAAATSLTVTLAAFGDALNATYGAFSLIGGPVTPGGGFSEIHDTAAGGVAQETEWQSGNDTTVDASWALSSAEGIAIEIKHAPAAAGVTWAIVC